ncbi:hypothetical protein CERZMDRAFT_102517 [Cercospora zeae-maydis SCOH1-5]|uniref:Uncharacterized protein n=1 Tax=Cercospora zeae-maydis SCOH1-5 TaxID=717836 RepID=A0A6A6F0F4_9PEZI|nr:hypothetical protein CERZMDRAFT_102517 [Cercospora zeae-maydis SCOH1-5]
METGDQPVILAQASSSWVAMKKTENQRTVHRYSLNRSQSFFTNALSRTGRACGWHIAVCFQYPLRMTVGIEPVFAGCFAIWHFLGLPDAM